LSSTYIATITRNGESREENSSGMSDQYRTTDLIQGKVLAALPWEGGRKTEAVARHAGLGEDILRRALEELVRRRMVTIDDRNYWRKKTLRLMSARASPVMHHSRFGRVYPKQTVSEKERRYPVPVSITPIAM
jgi:hypothetical protein